MAKLPCVVLDRAGIVELSGLHQSLLGGTVNQPDPGWSLGDGWATLHTDGLVWAFQRVAQQRWRAVNAPHLVVLVRARARFEGGLLVERSRAAAA